MALTIRRENPVQVLGGVPTVRRDLFIKSDAYVLLREELERHLNREVAGRSFLIAGHRGAGKTMLVATVIDDILNTIFKAAEDVNQARRAESGRHDTPIVQRPLLVKLHGPSLLGDGAQAGPDRIASPAPPGRASRPSPVLVQVVMPNAEQPAKPAAEAATPPDTIKSALVQITIGLYRALSDEFADFYAMAAQQGIADRRKQGFAIAELAELPARLRLELDSGADPALLRDCWARLDTVLIDQWPDWIHGFRRRADNIQSGIGRLEDGVLWPAAFARDWPDRGYQEIAALATAGQAYRICTGAVTASQRRSDNAARTESLELKSGGGLKDVADKLFALAAGAGVALSVPGRAGAAAGLLAALGAALTLSWSSSRTSHDERSQDYSFLPDLSVQSLDRDLPLVIDRIRKLGLTPVFVVDEIDKIEKPDDAIRALMRRLKQLTADYGFFCFLTDRDYYERVQGRLGAQVYPIEHTYFTHRVLISYRVQEIAGYLRGRVVTSLAASDPLFERERFAALLLGRVVMHRSELNTTQMVRELAAFTGPGNSVLETEARLRSFEPYRLGALLQLAIEHAMRQKEMSARIAADSRFAQIAADILYMISRAWREKKPRIDLGRAAIETELIHRMRLEDGTRGNGKAAAAALLDAALSIEDVDAFVGGVHLIADLMCDFSRLRREIDLAGELAVEDQPLLAVFDPPLLPLLRHSKDLIYTFRWDVYGILDVELDQDGAFDDGKGAAAGITRILELLQKSDLTADDLVSAGMLPVTMTAQSLEQSSRRVGDAARERTSYPEYGADVARLISLKQALRQRASAIGVVLLLANKLRSFTKGVGKDALLALQRYLPLPVMADMSGKELRTVLLDCIPDYAESDLSDRSLVDISNNPDFDSPEWSDIFFNDINPFRTADASAAWARWLEPVSDFLLKNVAVIHASVVDLALAAQGEPPGSLFRHDLSAMSIADWSTVTLEGAMFGTAPSWAILAGLAALGFSSNLIERLKSALADRPGGPDAAELALKLVPGPPNTPERPGILEIVVAGSEEAGLRGAEEPPIMRVSEENVSRYASALEWLQSFGAFGGLAGAGKREDSSDVRAGGSAA